MQWIGFVSRIEEGRSSVSVRCAAAALFGLLVSSAAAATDAGTPAPDGRAIFETRCAACHGSDGKSAPGRAAFEIDMPDFSDCSFASREPDADWVRWCTAAGPPGASAR